MNALRESANRAASVRVGLEALARARRVELQAVLSEFAVERFLWRMGRSPHADRFVLKGASLLRMWSQTPARAPWDVDELSIGSSEIAHAEAVVREIAAILGE